MRYSMIYRTLLILAVITASMPLALAEDESISIGSYSVDAGSTVDVTIQLENATLIAGGLVKLTYDPTIVNAIGFTPGDIEGYSAFNNGTSGVVTLAISSNSLVGTSSVLFATLTFEGVSSGTSILALHSDSYLSLEDGYTFVEVPLLSLSDGLITVSGSAGIIGDINGDGTVNYIDLGMLGASYGLSSGDDGYNASADLNGDSTVNYVDLGMLGAHYGESV